MFISPATGNHGPLSRGAATADGPLTAAREPEPDHHIYPLSTGYEQFCRGFSVVAVRKGKLDGRIARTVERSVQGSGYDAVDDGPPNPSGDSCQGG